MRCLYALALVFCLSVSAQKSEQNKEENKGFIDRKILSFPKPQYSENDSGIVVVKLWLHKNGDVLKVELDSIETTSKQVLTIEKTIKAAYNAKFNRIKQDTIEVGTISFDYTLK